MVDVYIHAGAHRTGTSSFQQMLGENRETLRAQGIAPAYPGRDGAPGGKLRLRLPAPRHGAKDEEKFRTMATEGLAAHCFPGCRRLVLSEENIPGRMMHFRKGQFYPQAARRAGVLAQALPGKLRHLLLVVRSYDALYVSGHRKRAEDNPVDAFDSLRPAFMAIDSGWPELVSALREALTPERVTVVSFAARGRSTDLLARLVGDLAAPVTEPRARVNRSATDAALIALQARYANGERLTRAEWKAVIAEHADDRAPRGFARFTPEESATLQARYARDLERLAGMAGVEFVG